MCFRRVGCGRGDELALGFRAFGFGLLGLALGGAALLAGLTGCHGGVYLLNEKWASVDSRICPSENSTAERAFNRSARQRRRETVERKGRGKSSAFVTDAQFGADKRYCRLRA